jgi:hypothetical protein
MRPAARLRGWSDEARVALRHAAADAVRPQPRQAERRWRRPRARSLIMRHRRVDVAGGDALRVREDQVEAVALSQETVFRLSRAPRPRLSPRTAALGVTPGRRSQALLRATRQP